MTALMIAAAMNFVTVDPGHFHAALVQKRTYPEVSPVVKVFAPDGAELDAHLKLIDSFNARTEGPTAWTEDVYRGRDYLAKFASVAKAGAIGEMPIAIFAGRNDLKGDYVLAAVEAGVNVLADKPLAITPDVFAKTEKAALKDAVAKISKTIPGVGCAKTDAPGVWRITYPAAYDNGHEAHFGQVVEMYLKWMAAGEEDPIYIDNMLVKYHTIVEAFKKSRK